MSLNNKHHLMIGFFLGFSFNILVCFAVIEHQSNKNKYLPQSIFEFCRTGYSMNYDGRTKGAIWVYEKLTRDLITTQTVTRGKYRFTEDKNIPESLRASNKDYLGSGYDRGHLHPAMTAKYSHQAMADAFLLSNASPQVPNLNRGLWRSLELEIYNLALNEGTVHVYTLPLYLPYEENNERFVRYKVIGDNDIAVPTHFAKIAIIEGKEFPLAYLLPNEPISPNTSLDQFTTTVEKIEKVSGIIFPHSFNRQTPSEDIE